MGVDEETKGKKFAMGTSVSPSEWERGVGEVASGDRRPLFYCLLVVGAPALGGYGNAKSSFKS